MYNAIVEAFRLQKIQDHVSVKNKLLEFVERQHEYLSESSQLLLLQLLLPRPLPLQGVQKKMHLKFAMQLILNCTLPNCRAQTLCIFFWNTVMSSRRYYYFYYYYYYY